MEELTCLPTDSFFSHFILCGFEDNFLADLDIFLISDFYESNNKRLFDCFFSASKLYSINLTSCSQSRT